MNGSEIILNNLLDILYTIFVKLGTNNIKINGYIVLTDLINKRLSIGKSSINEERVNELISLKNEYNKEIDKILFENIDRALNEADLDIIDVDLMRSSPTTVANIDTTPNSSDVHTIPETRISGNAINAPLSTNASLTTAPIASNSSINITNNLTRNAVAQNIVNTTIFLDNIKQALT